MEVVNKVDKVETMYPYVCVDYVDVLKWTAKKMVVDSICRMFWCLGDEEAICVLGMCGMVI